MKKNRIVIMFLNAALCVCIAVWVAGCGSDNTSSSDMGGSMLDPQLIGTWKIVAATISGVTTTCPGTDAASGFSCGANETMSLKSDGSYDEILISTPDKQGFWFAVNSRLMMDDTIADDNPAVYTYKLNGTTLTAKTLSGVISVVYERQGEPSTLSQQDILQSYPELGRSLLVAPNLIGTWKYASIKYKDTTITCPGDSGIPGISCGANEVVNFSDNNTFTETISNTSHSAGNWYALHGRLFMDDTEFDDSDPSGWMYNIAGNVLTMKMWGGTYTATLQRVVN